MIYIFKTCRLDHPSKIIHTSNRIGCAQQATLILHCMRVAPSNPPLASGCAAGATNWHPPRQLTNVSTPVARIPELTNIRLSIVHAITSSSAPQARGRPPSIWRVRASDAIRIIWRPPTSIPTACSWHEAQGRPTAGGNSLHSRHKSCAVRMPIHTLGNAPSGE